MKAVASCEVQVEEFKKTVVDAQGVIKQLTSNLASEKEEADRLSMQLQTLRGKERGRGLEELREKNARLSQQARKNAELFAQIQPLLAHNSHMEKEVLEKEKRIAELQAEKKALIERVEGLVRGAQAVLADPQGDKKHKVSTVIRMICNL